jgi:hypothetical protein
MMISLIYELFLTLYHPLKMGGWWWNAAFQKLAGLAAFPLQNTIGRFPVRVSRGLSVQLHGAELNLLLSVHQGFRAFNRLALDLDSHASMVYETQQRARGATTPQNLVVETLIPLRASIKRHVTICQEYIVLEIAIYIMLPWVF